MSRLPALAKRILILGVVLGVEALLASVLLDNDVLAKRPGFLIGLLHDWGAWAVKYVIGFAALFTTFAWLKYKAALASVSDEVAQSPIRPALIAAHILAMAVFAALSFAVYGGGVAPFPVDLLAAIWGCAAVAAIVFLGLALTTGALWVQLVQSTGRLWLYAAAAAMVACSAGAMSRGLWGLASRSTFALVRLILIPIVPDAVVQPDALRIGTHRFTVVISPQCSGLEGAVLLLMFGVLWLFLFRKESRFPQSLLLLPAALVVLFLLNAARIAALILIGHAGARDIALGGFHSQAGWMAFNSVAFAFSIAARRLTWFSNRPRQPESARETDNPSAAYLVPFLAILAAGMISRAASGGFESLYSLRFFCALAALWVFRRSYSDIDWKATWFAPLAGVAVFVLWIALDRFMSAGAVSHTPATLVNAPPALQALWIVLRVLTAVVAVPVAEELAFRGFLLRRFISARFEQVSFQAFTWFALLGSSLIFGLLHGERWLAGTVAGIVYALASLRRGRLGDAMVAHAVTNALLAGYVLGFHRWDLW